MALDSLLLPVGTLLAYSMVIVTLAISAASTLHQMVRLYQAQAAILCILVILQGMALPAVLPLAFIPAALALLVPTLLARASLNAASTIETSENQRVLVTTSKSRIVEALIRPPAMARAIWLRNGNSRLTGGVAAAIEGLVIAAAVLVAGRITPAEKNYEQAFYTVTLSLLIQGMFIMVNKQDVIAQIVGLLVADHALVVAAVLLAPPSLAVTFMFGLLWYLVLTLTILVWMLPTLNRTTNSIQLGHNTRLKG